MSIRILVCNWRVLRKPSLAPSVLISTNCLAVTNSELRSFSFSAGTNDPGVPSSLSKFEFLSKHQVSKEQAIQRLLSFNHFPMSMTICQRQACFMFFWQCYQHSSWFLPFGVNFSKSSELDDARFDYHCLQNIVDLGICRDRLSLLLSLGSSGTR